VGHSHDTSAAIERRDLFSAVVFARAVSTTSGRLAGISVTAVKPIVSGACDAGWHENVSDDAAHRKSNKRVIVSASAFVALGNVNSLGHSPLLGLPSLIRSARRIRPRVVTLEIGFPNRFAIGLAATIRSPLPRANVLAIAARRVVR
jgi:hypothetical protein